MPYLYVVVILAAAVVLAKSVGHLIDASSKIAARFSISNYTISFLLVAVSTSLPELVVGVTSAFAKTPILSFGDAIGANIALLTFVTSLPILVGTPISTRTIIHNKDVYFAVAFSFIPLLLIFDGTLTRIDGLALVLAYVSYAAYVLRRKETVEGLTQNFEHLERAGVWKHAAVFTISLALVLVASAAVVKSATEFSKQLGLSLGFIGLSLTAISTTLPEMAFSLAAVKKNQQFGILGNVVGSMVANSSLVLGITSLIYPIQVQNRQVGASPLLFLIFSVLLFLRFVRTKEKIDKREAAILLVVYALFIAGEYYLQLE